MVDFLEKKKSIWNEAFFKKWKKNHYEMGLIYSKDLVSCQGCSYSYKGPVKKDGKIFLH